MENDEDNLMLSMGLSGGFFQFKVDGTSMVLNTQSDPAISQFLESVVLPDATFGTLLYMENFYFGVSVNQLIRTRLKVFDVENGINQGRLNWHYFFTGGYKFNILDYIEIEPFFLLKHTTNLPLHIDISAKATYNERIWFGTSYITYDGMAFMTG